MGRRQRSPLGHARDCELRLARLPQDALVASDDPRRAVQPRHAVVVSGSDQRALHAQSDGPRSESLRPVARRARSRLSARSLCRRDEISRGALRRAWQDRAGRLLLRRAIRYRRAATVSESELRRNGTEALERGAVLLRSEVLLLQRSCPAVPRRDVVRVLPCRPESPEAAGRPEQPALGEPEQQRRRPVLLVGPRLQLEGRLQRRQLLLPAPPRVEARDARHVARVHRQHRQPADDERGVHARAAARARQAARQGDARRRRPEQQPAARLLHASVHGVDAARAQGRRGFGRCARRAESRVHQHRHVQRGVAAALPAADRRKADFAHRDLGGAAAFHVLECHGSADAQPRAVLSEEHRAAPSARCTRRQQVPQRGCRDARSGQDGVRRTVCALSLEQEPRAPAGSRSRELQRPRLPELLGSLLGVDEDGRVQEPDAVDRPGGRFPRRQLSVDGYARAGHAAPDERLQSAGDQRHPRQHLGQLLVGVLQEPSVRRDDQRLESALTRSTPVNPKK